MATDSAEHLLALLPQNRMNGINSTEIENDRKKYWEQFYSKYSAMSEAGLDDDSVTINDIDDNKLVERRMKHRVVLGAPISMTARRYLKQHAGDIDEMTTIAGPPASDEEDIAEEDTDEDDDEFMKVDSYQKMNPVQTLNKLYDQANNEVKAVKRSIDSAEEVISERDETETEGPEMDSDEDLCLFSPRCRTKYTVPSPVKASLNRSNAYMVPSPAKGLMNRSKQTTVSPSTSSLLSPTKFRIKTNDGVLSSTPDSRLGRVKRNQSPSMVPSRRGEGERIQSSSTASVRGVKKNRSPSLQPYMRGERSHGLTSTTSSGVERILSPSMVPSRRGEGERVESTSLAPANPFCPGCGTRLDESSLMLNSRAEELIVNCDIEQCDTCLVNHVVDSTHKECEIEECKVCIDIAAIVNSRNILRESFAELGNSGNIVSEENCLKNVSSFMERNDDSDGSLKMN